MSGKWIQRAAVIKAALAFDQRQQRFQQASLLFAEVEQLVAGSAEGESLVDVAGGEPLDGGVHRPQRTQHPPSHQPAEHE
jgi:hypothetical protein